MGWKVFVGVCILAAARDWGGGWCPGVRVMYGGFGGATVHGDVAYSTQIYSLFYKLL